MSQSPRNRPPVRRVVPGQEAGGQAPPPRSGARQPQPQRPRQQTNVNAPRRSDPFPLVIGGIFAVLVVGLLVLVFLFSMNRGNNGPVTSAGQPTTIGASDANNSGVNAVPTQAPGADQTQAAAPTVEPAPRMPLDQFLALYDDPAKRPLIIDVRAKESYDQGHIAGAISFPEADVDTRINELPKDKLIVAYCQWPAENESARVAEKLHSQYGFSYDNLKVLLGGWNTWKQQHATDPAKYPEGGLDATPGASGQSGLNSNNPAPAITVIIPTPKP